MNVSTPQRRSIGFAGYRPTRRSLVEVRYLVGSVTRALQDESLRTVKNPYTVDWQLILENFYARSELALPAFWAKLAGIAVGSCTPSNPSTLTRSRLGWRRLSRNLPRA